MFACASLCTPSQDCGASSKDPGAGVPTSTNHSGGAGSCPDNLGNKGATEEDLNDIVFGKGNKGRGKGKGKARPETRTSLRWTGERMRVCE